MSSTPGPSRCPPDHAGGASHTGLSQKASNLLSAILSQAREETNKNFRPPPAATSGVRFNSRHEQKSSSDHPKSASVKNHGSSARGRKQIGKPAGRPGERSNLFRVSKIVFLPYGLDVATGELPLTWAKTPRKQRIQELQQFGLAILAGGSGKSDQIVLDDRWSAYELFGFLKDRFPQLFRYLLDEDPSLDDFDGSSADYRLPYALLVSEYKKLQVVPGDRNPDGAQCRYNKGRDSAGWRESSVFLVTRRPILPAEYGSWKLPTRSKSRTPARDISPAPSDQSHATSLPLGGSDDSDRDHNHLESNYGLEHKTNPMKGRSVVQYRSSAARSRLHGAHIADNMTSSIRQTSLLSARQVHDRKGKGKALPTIDEEDWAMPSPGPSKRKRDDFELTSDLERDDSTDRDIEDGLDGIWRSSEPPSANSDDPEATPLVKRRRVVSQDSPSLHTPAARHRTLRSVSSPAAAALPVVSFRNTQSRSSKPSISAPTPTATYTAEGSDSQQHTQSNALLDIIDLTSEHDDTHLMPALAPASAGASGAHGLGRSITDSAIPLYTPPATQTDEVELFGLMSSPSATHNSAEQNPWNTARRKPELTFDF